MRATNSNQCKSLDNSEMARLSCYSIIRILAISSILDKSVIGNLQQLGTEAHEHSDGSNSSTTNTGISGTYITSHVASRSWPRCQCPSLCLFLKPVPGPTVPATSSICGRSDQRPPRSKRYCSFLFRQALHIRYNGRSIWQCNSIELL